MNFTPLKIYLYFSLFSLSTLYITPIKYYELRTDLIVGFISFYLLFFSAGFYFGVKGIRTRRHATIITDTASITSKRVIFSKIIFSKYGWIVRLSLIYWAICWIEVFMSGKAFSINPGENYLNLYTDYERGTGSGGWRFFVDSFFIALTTVSMVSSYAYWPAIEKSAKRKIIFISASYVLISFLIYGKQKYMGDLLIYTAGAYIIHKTLMREKIKNQQYLIAILIITTSLAFFSFALFLRYSAAEIGYKNIASVLHPLNYWDDENFILKLIPSDIAFSISLFLMYFANGIYGLNLGLQLPFEWTFFVGNSYSMTRIAENIFDIHDFIFNKTYPIRIDNAFGWGFSKWHTIFPWIASDFTFFGVLPITLVFAFLYGTLWRQSIRISNPGAAPLFIFLNLGVAFSYANNQIFHSLQGIITLIILIAIYLRTINIR